MKWSCIDLSTTMSQLFIRTERISIDVWFWIDFGKYLREG